MAEAESPSTPKDEELELSLEELLEVRDCVKKSFPVSCWVFFFFNTNEFGDDALQVRRAPQRRGTPRPNRSKPHVIRPVEDVTAEEIELVADNMTDKVYNSVTVSPEPGALLPLTRELPP